MEVSLIWLTVIIVLAGSLFSLARRKKKTKRLPPSPKGVPILGHLHMMGKNPHQDLQRIAREHGPIVYMRFGFVPNIVVSSPEAAELFLKTHDHVFADRPPHEASRYISWDQKNLTFGAYGPYWRNMRKLCTLELLSTGKINTFQPMRREELGLFVESLKESAEERIAVDLSAMVTSLTTDMSCRMVFGKKYDGKIVDEKGFKPLMTEGMKLAAVPNLGEFFPLIGILDLQGLTRRMKAFAQIFEDFFEKIIDDHVRAGDHGQTKDFVDILLQDMFVASSDTASSTVEWILSELHRLEYLDMVVKETFRLHPGAPLLLPHYAMEDSTVSGYDIPKESRILINIYAIGRDPNVWTDPEKFIPERFAGSEIDVRGKHFQLLPFGSGRRGCPGMQLALIQVRLIVSQLVHCFDWQLPNGMLPKELDMAEEFGLVVTRANHLMAIPTFRLQN